MVRARLAAPRGFEPRLTDPKSAVLPLDEGAEDRSLGRHGPGRQHAGSGAEDGTRTRDPHLGKVMLYQLSHFRSKNRASPIVWCREPGSNWRHRDFQSRALPTELSRPVQQTDWLPVGARKGNTRERAAARKRKGGRRAAERPLTWRPWGAHHAGRQAARTPLPPIRARSEPSRRPGPSAHHRRADAVC